MSKILSIYGWGFGIVAIVFAILTSLSFAFFDVTLGLLMGIAMFFFELVSMIMFIKANKPTQIETSGKVSK